MCVLTLFVVQCLPPRRMSGYNLFMKEGLNTSSMKEKDRKVY